MILKLLALGLIICGYGCVGFLVLSALAHIYDKDSPIYIKVHGSDVNLRVLLFGALLTWPVITVAAVCHALYTLYKTIIRLTE